MCICQICYTMIIMKSFNEFIKLYLIIMEEFKIFYILNSYVIIKKYYRKEELIMKKYSIRPIWIIIALFMVTIISISIYGFNNIKTQVAQAKQIQNSKDEKNLLQIEQTQYFLNSKSNIKNIFTKTVAASSKKASDNINKWQANKVYLKGDKVIYKKKVYRAKWWTQNEVPSKSDVWEETKETPKQDDNLTNNDTNLKSDDDFRVLAYYPSWHYGSTYDGTKISDKVQFDKITHMIYAFAIPTKKGNLRSLENEDVAIQLVNNCHKYGVKAMISIGGWSYNGKRLEDTFVSATKTAKKRKKFAKSIVNICNKYGFDGVDIDWEYPRANKNSAKQYEKFIVLLSNMLHKEDKLLSSAVLSGVTPNGNIYYDIAAQSDKVLNAVDWINVMAYDGGDNELHSSYDFAINSGNYWLNTRKVPASKINLGVPFYGKPNPISYENILKQNSDAWNTDKSVINGRKVYYNGIKTIKDKTEYAKKNLGGIMIWEITQDTSDRSKSLLSAISDVINSK